MRFGQRLRGRGSVSSGSLPLLLFDNKSHLGPCLRPCLTNPSFGHHHEPQNTWEKRGWQDRVFLPILLIKKLISYPGRLCIWLAVKAEFGS